MLRKTIGGGAILTGYYTGLRLGDVACLLWESVDLAEGVLRVRPQKTRKTQKKAAEIPIHDELRAWLEAQPRGIGKRPLFASLFGKKSGGAGGLSAQFAKLMVKAGITRRLVRKGDGAGHRTSDLSFHCLRHSFNSALANAGVAQQLRQKLTGHASAAMNDRYTHVERETMRVAVAKLPALITAK